jgi:type IV secretion system protein VirB10
MSQNQVTAQPTQPNIDSVDKGLPDLHTSSKKNIKRLLVYGTGILFFLGLAGVGALKFKKQMDEQQAKRVETKQTVETGKKKDFGADKAEMQKADAEALANLPPPATVAVEIPAPQTVTPLAPPEPSLPRQNQPASTEAVETPLMRKMSGSVLYGDGDSTGGSSSNSSGGISLSGLGQAIRKDIEDGFDNRVQPSVMADGKAQKRADLTFLLKRGTMIPCVLKTKIITEYPGMTACQVNQDVYSANGKVLLLEKGSTITGEQRSNQAQGKSRVFVLWSRVDTPNGVKVDLDSYGTDALGASGHHAHIETHFWKRFGAALMLSTIDDLAKYAIESRKKSGSQVNFENSSDAAGDMAAKALENSINIPPTAYINHGISLNVFVSRDIDFRSIYELVNINQ